MPNPSVADRSAELLAASELRYRRLFEAAKDGVLILDAATGRVSRVRGGV
jgi:PAS domain-containing protein